MDTTHQKEEDLSSITITTTPLNKTTIPLQPNTVKYRKQISSIVTDINSELNKLLASSATVKNILDVEADLVFLTKKIQEIKKALVEKNNEPQFSSSHVTRIHKGMEKLIDIASKNEISEEDQKLILKELRVNIGEANGLVVIVKKALFQSDNLDRFNFDK